METKKIIYYKAFFSSWAKVSREEALRSARDIYRRMTTTSDPARRAAIVNKNHVRGYYFTAQELRADSEVL